MNRQSLIIILVFLVAAAGLAAFYFYDYYSEPTMIESHHKHKAVIDSSSQVELLYLPAPDQKKSLTITEIRDSFRYVHTGALISWAKGGGAVFYYEDPNANIAAEWQDGHTLRITYDKGLMFTKKEGVIHFLRDSVQVIYSVR